MISAKLNNIEDSNKFLIYAKVMTDVERELYNSAYNKENAQFNFIITFCDRLSKH